MFLFLVSSCHDQCISLELKLPLAASAAHLCVYFFVGSFTLIISLVSCLHLLPILCAANFL